MGCGCKKNKTQAPTTNTVVVNEGSQTQEISVDQQQLEQLIDKVNQLNSNQG